jgi:hypothetical protein
MLEERPMNQFAGIPKKRIFRKNSPTKLKMGNFVHSFTRSPFVPFHGIDRVRTNQPSWKDDSFFNEATYYATELAFWKEGNISLRNYSADKSYRYFWEHIVGVSSPQERIAIAKKVRDKFFFSIKSLFPEFGNRTLF